MCIFAPVSFTVMAIKIQIKVWEDFQHEQVVITACGSVRFLQKKHALYFAKTRKQQFYDLLDECLNTNSIICKTMTTCKDLRALQVVSSSQQRFFDSYHYIAFYSSRDYIYLENHLICMFDELLLMCDALGLKCQLNRIDRTVEQFYCLKYTNFAKSFEIVKRKKYKSVFNIVNNKSRLVG